MNARLRRSRRDLPRLSDDEHGLARHVGMWGSKGYPIAKLGRGWIWRDWRSVRGTPIVYKTRAEVSRAFERWLDLYRIRYAEERRAAASERDPRARRDAGARRPSWKERLVKSHHVSEGKTAIARLKAAVASARMSRNEALVRVRTYCRSLRKESRASNTACTERGAEEASTWAPRLDGALQTLAEERNYQASMRRSASWSSRKARARSTGVARRSESNDAVRSNLPPDLVPLFEKVKRQIKGSARKSRTEEFLEYAESHPSEVLDVRGIEDETERMIREHEESLRRSAGSARDPRISPAKRHWISEKVRLLRREGRPPRQAVAIAYRLAGVPPRTTREHLRSSRGKGRT